MAFEFREEDFMIIKRFLCDLQKGCNINIIVTLWLKRRSGLDTPPASALDLLLSLGGHFCVGLDLLLYLGS